MEQRPGWSPPAWKRPCGVSDPGCETVYVKDAMGDTGREVEIHLSSGSKWGGSIIDNGRIYQETAEHGYTGCF